MQSSQRSSMTTVTVGALLTAAIGILLQYVSGVGDFPTIPPGPIILAVLAAIGAGALATIRNYQHETPAR